MKANIFVATLLLFCLACTSQQGNQLTEQQKDQIKNQVKLVADSIIIKAESGGSAWLQYYLDTPEMTFLNADGSRWDFQTAKKASLDTSFVSWKWTSTRQEFPFITADLVVCAWEGKDESTMRSGDKITFDPHAYTMIFKKIAGQWKVVYSHDSGIPVSHKPGKK